ncbi:MAG TPA: hypothetical protein VLH56_19650 [Dissulfurispiraceae bacterium]|nr:hypothetical protein [Dissulfurispiraceae bacterium]
MGVAKILPWNDTDMQALRDTARVLGTSPEWLYKLIMFESGGDPLIRAKMPYNAAQVKAGAQPRYARGLIQFIDSTAASLGYRDSLDLVEKHPSRVSQLLGPVRQYLSQFKPLSSEQSLYMAVFYPAARSWPMDRPFPPNVQAANPGIKTPGDYVAFVRRRAAPTIAALAGGSLGLLLLAGFFFL